MNPTGSYERFEQDILNRFEEHDEESRITFGILIADPRQTEAREYILNYLNTFHIMSGKNFNFFIPGFLEEPYLGGDKIRIENKTYFFNERIFDGFCYKLYKKFNIVYTFNPMLVLMSMYKGRSETAEYIIIELDDYDTHGVRRSGNLFLEIFSAAEKDCSLDGLRESFLKTYVQGNALETIISAIGQDWLTEITKTSKELRRFRIKSRE